MRTSALPMASVLEALHMPDGPALERLEPILQGI
jgi:hypothetical protein